MGVPWLGLSNQRLTIPTRQRYRALQANFQFSFKRAHVVVLLVGRNTNRKYINMEHDDSVVDVHMERAHFVDFSFKNTRVLRIGSKISILRLLLILVLWTFHLTWVFSSLSIKQSNCLLWIQSHYQGIGTTMSVHQNVLKFYILYLWYLVPTLHYGGWP